MNQKNEDTEREREMKLSVKIRDEQQHKNPLVKAKVPVTIVGLPFFSGIIAGEPSDLSFNLSTNFLSGPSLKLSYAPTTTATATAVTTAPFTLSLKSGVGIFGSPRNSPLVISAHFNLFSTNHSPNFSLQIKPQFGHFSLHKTTSSNSIPKQNRGSSSNYGSGSENDEYRNGFVPDGSSVWTNITLESCGEKGGIKNLNPNPNSKEDCGNGIGVGPEKPLVWKDLTMESCNGENGILSGVNVRARTTLPVTSRFVVNCRWGMNFPADIGKKLPYLTVEKIGIERVEEVKKKKKEEEKGIENNVGDAEMLKGMCYWMGRNLEVLQNENWELKQSLEKLRAGVPATARNYGFENVKVEKSKALPSSVENSAEFERWRTKRSNGGEEDNNSKRELKKPTDRASDIESELQKAIKAASTSS